jgi:hypothetical protein
LIVVPSCVYKWSINPFTNPNPVYRHTPNRDDILASFVTGLEFKIETYV